MREQFIEKLKSIKGSTARTWKTKFNKQEFDYILENIFQDTLEFPFVEIRYSFINKIMIEPICPVCCVPVKFKHGSYQMFCSNGCKSSKEGKKIHHEHTKNAIFLKYGVENISQLKETQDKIKRSSMKKYGVEHFTQNKDVKNKVKSTNLEKYGFETAYKNKDVQAKAKATNLEKYGVENVFQNEEIKDKIKATNLEKYGVECFRNTDLYVEKAKATNLEKYGVEWSQQNEEVKEKVFATNIEKYGFKCSAQNEDIKAKIKATNLERYGVEYTFLSDEINAKVKATTLERYGVEYAQQTDEYKHKAQLAYREKFYDTFILQLQQKKIEPLFTKEEYLIIDYCQTLKKYKCLKCNKEFDSVDIAVQKIYCPHHSSRSQAELDIQEWVLNENSELNIIMNKRLIYNGKNMELYLYLPDFKLGIEYHGLYWHSDINKDKNYHKNKYEFFKKQGITVIQIFENEWVHKQEIVKSIIRTKLSLIERKLYGRKCTIKVLKNDEYKQFCELNHIQGYGVAKYRLGLFYEDELVQIMSFSKSRFNKDYDLENIRTCTKINTVVVGGFSKLLKHFKSLTDESIISYVDVRYFTGGGYLSNGFDFKNHSDPNFFYFKNNGSLILENRQKYQKHKLEAVLDVFDPNLTAHSNMVNNKFLRIYDAGNLVLISN